VPLDHALHLVEEARHHASPGLGIEPPALLGRRHDVAEQDGDRLTDEQHGDRV
jgi:hypothetical protein